MICHSERQRGVSRTAALKSRELGVLDKAGNEWDMNDGTDEYENKVTRTFGIAADGSATHWTETFAWEDW